MGRRPNDPWFTDDGKPILRDGLYKNSPSADYLYDFRFRRKHFKGSTGESNDSLAKEWLAAYKKRLKDESFGKVEPAPITLEKLWEEWDRLKSSSTSDSHRRWMGNVVQIHAAAYLKRPAPDLTMAAFEELRHTYLTTKGEGYRKDEGHTVRTHSEGGWNKVAGQLRALYRWAVARKMLAGVPFEVKRLAVSLEAKGVLWPEQVQSFLAEVDSVRKVRKGDLFPHAGIAVRMMIGLGLRENEALNAEWDRVDWRRHVFIVAQAIVTGKKVKDRTIREIPIPGWLESYLLKWWVFCERPSRGLLMVSKMEEVHGPGATETAVRMGADKLSITNMTPHSLRYTFATVHFELGTSLSQIQQMMGHEKPETTLGYIIQRPKDQAESQEKAGEAMGFPPT